jgi:AGCS family alanine or glycine:cation symporter
MVQANTTSAALADVFPIDKVWIGIALAGVTGLVILGGVKRIAEVVSFFVPIMVLLYFGGALYIILTHLEELPAGLSVLFGRICRRYGSPGDSVGSRAGFVFQRIGFG